MLQSWQQQLFLFFYLICNEKHRKRLFLCLVAKEFYSEVSLLTVSSWLTELWQHSRKKRMLEKSLIQKLLINKRRRKKYVSQQDNASCNSAKTTDLFSSNPFFSWHKVACLVFRPQSYIKCLRNEDKKHEHWQQTIFHSWRAKPNCHRRL